MRLYRILPCPATHIPLWAIDIRTGWFAAVTDIIRTCSTVDRTHRCALRDGSPVSARVLHTRTPRLFYLISFPNRAYTGTDNIGLTHSRTPHLRHYHRACAHAHTPPRVSFPSLTLLSLHCIGWFAVCATYTYWRPHHLARTVRSLRSRTRVTGTHFTVSTLPGASPPMVVSRGRAAVSLVATALYHSTSTPQHSDVG